MMVEEKYFLTLLVYNGDTSPHYVRHFVEGKDKAIRLAARLTRAVRANKNLRPDEVARQASSHLRIRRES
jgi:hypothetical protein